MSASGGWTIHRFTTVTSTQHVAADLIARGAPHRTAVVADRQTAGYGRKGDRWLDAPGDSLLLTLILRPATAAADTAAIYPMIAALAALDAIEACTQRRGAVKWPNDLLLGGKKVGGILGDATWSGGRLDAVRIGTGLNLRGAHADFAARGLPDATSIAAETGRDLDRDDVLDALLRSFSMYDDILSREDAGVVVAAWRANVATIGQAVTVTTRDGRVVAGTARSVSDSGDLILAVTEGKIEQFDAATVTSVRPR
jgi:BirA family biotin operon repressor/biotin-[acetyl-CoA-carboxylase] ligase